MRARYIGTVGGLLASALVIAGCSDGAGLADVTGSITVDGAPAEKGSITFIPDDGKGPTAGGEIVAGRYAARVPVGTSKVQVRIPKVVGHKKLYNTPDSPSQDLLAEVLPERYNTKTELRLEVKPGKNEKDWELKTK